ncbi:MAG: hypothetical protein H0U27_02890 [Nitrosopumilus sp.]|nr:hypothetical protein [Nitrosopumilus sp.]
MLPIVSSLYGFNVGSILQINYKVIGNLSIFVQGQANFLQTIDKSGGGVIQPPDFQGSLGLGGGLHYAF